MEVEVIQTQAPKLRRIGNGRNDPNKIGQKKVGEQYQDDDEEDGEEGKKGSHRLHVWHNSSRVCRVSKASGGKDRHSKVYTAKGLRDRRVRLSVSTAIQFYDLQDRLGYDQPSKAVEWLIKAAADAIAELPSLNCSFPDTPPKQPSDEKSPRASEPRFDSSELEIEIEPTTNYQQQQQQHISLSKSACSSTSETSKGSVLSLTRNEIRVKARERARERAAKEKKVKEEEEPHVATVNSNPQNSSFTELLTAYGNGASNNSNNSTVGAQQNHGGGLDFGLKPTRYLPSTTHMDYFGAGIFGLASSRVHNSSGFSSQTHFGNPPPPQSMAMLPPFNVTADHHPELQQISFLADHLTAGSESDYNLNFTSSSVLTGFNRGTLQSNSPSPLLPQLQRFSSPLDGPNIPFFIGTAAASPAAHLENHQFPTGLQLCYGEECRNSDPKGKGKS